MKFLFNRTINNRLAVGDEEISTTGLLFPSFVKTMGQLFSNYGGQPLRDINIVRVTAIVASIAVFIGIGISIALMLVDLFAVMFA